VALNTKNQIKSYFRTYRGSAKYQLHNLWFDWSGFALPR